jgi:RNA polymerase sigma-70 factor (ECF subfamily)
VAGAKLYAGKTRVVAEAHSCYRGDNAMSSMAGATTLGDLASALPVRAEEASIVAELKAGSEEAYAWLIAQYHQPIYSLVYRVLNDPADAADTTQEVFLKVYRGMKRFNGASSLKTWMYRIAVHEAPTSGAGGSGTRRERRPWNRRTARRRKAARRR